jgi:hypothetical protein
LGPMKTMPSSPQRRAKLAFSDRNSWSLANRRIPYKRRPVG